MPAADIYFSTDVEADGPIPGPHSMLSFASAAFRADKTLIGTFEANLTLPGHPEVLALGDMIAVRDSPGGEPR